ncbi:MAG TPA: hypothetical protein VM285_16495 [Polyangia bacterium]|nr:hypothetical protein [Polyangia bacterium]
MDRTKTGENVDIAARPARSMEEDAMKPNHTMTLVLALVLMAMGA